MWLLDHFKLHVACICSFCHILLASSVLEIYLAEGLHSAERGLCNHGRAGCRVNGGTHILASCGHNPFALVFGRGSLLVKQICIIHLYDLSLSNQPFDVWSRIHILFLTPISEVVSFPISPTPCVY